MKSRPFCIDAVAMLLASWLLPGCSGTEGPGAAAPQGSDECSATQQRASKQVLDVAHAASSRECATDQDCTTVSIGGSCFDNCTRAVSTSAVSSVEAAIQSADASECKAFAQNGCKLIHPPCAPPSAPTCKAGLCE